MSKPAGPPKITAAQQFASFPAAGILKLLGLTLRLRCVDDADFLNPKRRKPLIHCLWHNRLLGAALGQYRLRNQDSVPLKVLTSASKDGGWLAAVAERLRMGAVRGSSSRRGAAALLELTRTLAQGSDIVITPDGPRGPNYSIAPGVLFLAQRTGVGVVPVEIQINRRWHIGKKWDALWIPKPFAKVTLHFHCPYFISEGADFAEESARLDAALGEK